MSTRISFFQWVGAKVFFAFCSWLQLDDQFNYIEYPSTPPVWKAVEVQRGDTKTINVIFGTLSVFKELTLTVKYQDERWYLSNILKYSGCDQFKRKWSYEFQVKIIEAGYEEGGFAFAPKGENIGEFRYLPLKVQRQKANEFMSGKTSFV